ncbi:MAG: c-type cytochrome [Candidatus Obscuribacter sp.]|jgi:mono/diheme cytochrome c family protein|nr:c-type cytochrome [Candidatus Obscuribacter sp.]MBK9772556.1 c-type cytochrome [Candidatus Obscuribacter sp.]MBL0186801.1 c-type cytochrome [Candidatus Obscuribacter sp.]MBP6592842.1 c-type cytochrome [Candidatus Obscuribacter sp.]
MRRIALALGLIVAGLAVLPQGVAKGSGDKADTKLDGKEVYLKNCASCHLQNGDNKVNSKKPVAGSDKLKTLAHFKKYLSDPPGHMPYYEHIVNDKKVLEALYKYCKSLPPLPTKQACL